MSQFALVVNCLFSMRCSLYPQDRSSREFHKQGSLASLFLVFLLLPGGRRFSPPYLPTSLPSLLPPLIGTVPKSVRVVYLKSTIDACFVIVKYARP